MVGSGNRVMGSGVQAQGLAVTDISVAKESVRKTDYAKQSQFRRPHVLQNKANLWAGCPGSRGRLHETNPICREAKRAITDAQEWGYRKAAWRMRRGKQSQFIAPGRAQSSIINHP
jgi:hypothetical protein